MIVDISKQFFLFVIFVVLLIEVRQDEILMLSNFVIHQTKNPTNIDEMCYAL